MRSATLGHLGLVAVGVVGALGVVGTGRARADTTVTPRHAQPGDPVLVTVTADPARKPPTGKAGGQPLAFFAGRHGFEAVFAVPLDINEDHVLVETTTGDPPVTIAIDKRDFPETKLVVEEELANPSDADGKLIADDNRAIAASYARADGPAQFAHAFRRPPGATTSPFGEWRTFNDGHRAQHVGLDLVAAEGSRVAAIDDGTVALVRSTFLAGNVVVVAHGGGIASLYFHLSRASVAEGDRVKQGQEIGRAGHTGRTTGPHLHLGIRVPGGLVDPAAFLKLAI